MTDYDTRTRDELYDLASEREIDGRSDMTKDQLVAALRLTDLGPNAVDLLLRQHEEFRVRITEFRELSSRPSKRKAELVGELSVDLVKHSMIEEQIFYPTVRNEVDGLAEQIDEDLEEHHVVDVLLAELESMTPADERFDAKVTVLIENTEHHLEEEEDELFPQVRKQMSDERLRELGGAMVALWQRAPLRPHPRAPQTPPGNVLLALPMAAWDIGRTLLRLVMRRK